MLCGNIFEHVQVLETFLLVDFTVHHCHSDSSRTTFGYHFIGNNRRTSKVRHGKSGMATDHTHTYLQRILSVGQDCKHGVGAVIYVVGLSNIFVVIVK